MMLSKALLSVLVCPVSKGKLVVSESEQELISIDARLAYPIRDFIPILLVDEARELSVKEVQNYQVNDKPQVKKTAV